MTIRKRKIFDRIVDQDCCLLVSCKELDGVYKEMYTLVARVHRTGRFESLLKVSLCYTSCSSGLLLRD